MIKGTEIKKNFIRYAIPADCLHAYHIVTMHHRQHFRKLWRRTTRLGSFMSNIVLDYLLVIVFGLGMHGAAIGTVTASLIAFTSLIKKVEIGKIAGGWRDLKRIFFNRSSEMITSVATSISTYIFNIFLMRHTGYLGVAALTIVFYLNMLVNFSTIGTSQAITRLFFTMLEQETTLIS